MIDRVVGNYRIVEQVGEGGMGAVYRAVDLMLDREVAIKAIRPELTRDTEIVERFRAEARMLARVHHPAIATIFSFFVDGGDLYLAMEYVRGQTLARLIQAGGPMPWERAVPLLSTALEGIEEAHRAGIVHRDLKPENLMITDAGAVKVMDFGIARVVGSGRLTRTGLLIGTLRYMAPEQIRGEEADRRTDVYALGTVLYEMLTGAVPFDGASDYAVLKAQVEEEPRPPSASIPAVPAWLDQAILKALAKEPAQRFQTVDEMRRHLLGSGQPLTTAAVVPLPLLPLFAQPVAGGGGAAAPDTPAMGDAPDPDGTVLRPGAPGAAAGVAAEAAARGGMAMAPGTGAAGAGSAAGAVGAANALSAGSAAGAAGAAGGGAAPGGGEGGASYREMPPWRPAAASGAGGRRSEALFTATLVLVAIVALALGYRLWVPASGPAAGTGGAKRTVGTAGAAGAAGDQQAGVAGDPARGNATAAAGQPQAGAGRQAAGAGGTPEASGAGDAGLAGAGAPAGALPAAAAPTVDQGAGAGGTGTLPGSRAPAAAGGTAGGGAEAEPPETSGAGGDKTEAVGAKLHRLSMDLVAESARFRILYEQHRRGHETSADEQLDDALKEFHGAAERFNGQFQAGFFARSRMRLGRLTHGEDERGQMQRLARGLVDSSSRVDSLMLQARPPAALRQIWRRIHAQVQRVAQECGI